MRCYWLSESSDYPNLTDAIWVYDDHDPPSRREEEVVKKLYDIEFTATTPFEELPIETNDAGATYRKFTYEFHVTSYGSSVDIVVYANGERLGGKNLTIDYDVSGARYPSRQKEWHAQPAASGFGKKKDDLASTDDEDKVVVKPPPYTDFAEPQPTPAGFDARVMAIRTSAALRGSGIAERLDSSS
jgi:hypothetical protein